MLLNITLNVRIVSDLIRSKFTSSKTQFNNIMKHIYLKTILYIERAFYIIFLYHPPT